MNSKSIVLGENNADTKIDCDNFNVCADPLQEFGPEKIIFPSNYNYPAFRHDIALIKLNRAAKISGYFVGSEKRKLFESNLALHYTLYRMGHSHMFAIRRIVEPESHKFNWRSSWMGTNE